MMTSPFPGMDPYLENPNLWPDAHGELIRAMRAQLVPQLRPRYTAHTEIEILVDAITDEEEIATMYPDVGVVRQPAALAPAVAGGYAAPAATRIANPVVTQVRQASIHIRAIPGGRLVTVIELLSPVNKRPGDSEYAIKRRKLLNTQAHLLEIDLLRRGRRVALTQLPPDAPYFVFLSRGDERPWCDIWPLALWEAIPVIPVPLLPSDPDATIDLNVALSRIYDEAGYDLLIDYTANVVPPLAAEDAAWADALLREKGLRS